MTYQGVIFQVAGVAGWTTVYYINAASAAAAMASLQSINTDQLATQASLVFTEALRVSDVQIRGDGLVAVPNTTQGSLVITPPDTLCPLNLAVLHTFEDATFTHRVRHYIHGIRQSDIATDATGHTICNGPYRSLAAVGQYHISVMGSSVNWEKRSIPPVTHALTTADTALNMSVRRVGRPFDLFRGRRRTV